MANGSLRETASVVHVGSRRSQDPRQLRCRMGAELCRAAAAVVLRSRLRLRGRRQPTVSFMLRSAIAASIRTGSTRSSPMSSRCSICLRGRAPARLPIASADSSRRRSWRQHRALRAAVVSRPPRHRRRRRGRLARRRPTSSSTASAPIVLSVKFIDEDVLAEIASRLQLRNLRKVDDRPVAAGDYVFDLTDRQGIVDRPLRLDAASSPAPRSSTASFPSSRSRSPASRCSPASCCATCAAPRRPSPPARTGCAISRCTIRCAACRTASSSASGSKR